MDKTVIYRPINRLLIANRGEIAVRIIRTAKKMGITTVGIVTQLEHISQADESILVEGSSIESTFLNIEAMVKAAVDANVDAIHPGYGFLSENPHFAEAVEKAGLIFVGPSSTTIEKVGDKTAARLIAQNLDIPIAKGLHGTADEIHEKRDILRYPLIIKAAAGGGGKGMQLVSMPKELSMKLQQAQREARRYFNDDILIAEQYIEQPRHIEIQIVADCYGNIIHLYERECSIQRRYQKIVEEAPSSFVSPRLREKLTSDAIKICKAIAYHNVGTVEFLVDNSGNHYFLEMNTRIQVEHPVTEMITSIDIVKQQLLIAMGLPLELSQQDIAINGHAIECRIYAEDPSNNFLPAPGRIEHVEWPTQKMARTDSWFTSSIDILPEFDPMLGKIITHAPSRSYAIEKMKRALESTSLIGPINNIWYLKKLMDNTNYQEGNIDSSFCEKFQVVAPTSSIESLVAATLIHQFKRPDISTEESLWNRIGYFRLTNTIRLKIEDKIVEVTYNFEQNKILFSVNGNTYIVEDIHCSDRAVKFRLNSIKYMFKWFSFSYNSLVIEKNSIDTKIEIQPKIESKKIITNTSSNGIDEAIKASIPGKIVAVNIKEGEHKRAGETVIVLESMKMENSIQMPRDGMVKKIFIEQGNQVEANELLVEIEDVATN